MSMHRLIVRVARPALAAAALGVAAGALAQVPGGSSLPLPLPQTAEQWKQAAIQDIEEAVRLTIDHHPGAHDPANPRFLADLDRAREHGLALAARVDSAAAYGAALLGFNTAIGDGHAGMFADAAVVPRPQERWPGFVTVWRDKGLYVYASEDGGPAVGARVVGCDGKPIEDLIRQNVFSFSGKASEPGHWWSRARNVFRDSGNPFVSLPKHCRFAMAGKTFAHDLAWKPVDEQTSRWREESYNGQPLEVGITEPRRGLFWLAMPTFQPDERQRAAYRAMHQEIQQRRQAYLDADAVVIDLRQNQGGSSVWSRQVAQVLWGADRVERRMKARFAKSTIWWRASKGNTDHVAALVERFTKEGPVESLEWAKTIHAGMQAALASGDRFYVEANMPAAPVLADPGADLPADPPPFTKPVYVIVPGQCASACLDALDVFTRFANTKLIGAPSSSDSTYMEVRLQAVRSGRAQVVIPNKVYVNRPRGNGEGYLPSIPVNELVWSVDSLLKVVERDLRERGGGRS